MTENRPTGETTPAAGDQFVQSLARGLAVIRAFDGEHQSMTLSQVATRTNLNRAAARRFLLTLIQLGYVRSDGRDFELTPLVLQLGYSFLAGQRLPELAQPILEDLSHQFGESTSIAILDGSDIVYLARLHTRRIMTVGISPGTRFPAYATSMGRVLLATLPEHELAAYLDQLEMVALTPKTITSKTEFEAELARVRKQGYALIDQELELGLRSVAVPVHGTAGRTLAAINLAMSAMTASDETDAIVARVIPAMQKAANSIGEAAIATGVG